MTIQQIIEKYEWITNRIKHAHTRQVFRECLAALKAYVAEQEKNDARPTTKEKPVPVRKRPKRGRPRNADSGNVEAAKTRGVSVVPKATTSPPRNAPARKRNVGRKADAVPGRYPDNCSHSDTELRTGLGGSAGKPSKTRRVADGATKAERD